MTGGHAIPPDEPREAYAVCGREARCESYRANLSSSMRQQSSRSITGRRVAPSVARNISIDVQTKTARKNAIRSTNWDEYFLEKIYILVILVKIPVYYSPPSMS